MPIIKCVLHQNYTRKSIEFERTIVIFYKKGVCELNVLGRMKYYGIVTT